MLLSIASSCRSLAAPSALINLLAARAASTIAFHEVVPSSAPQHPSSQNEETKTLMVIHGLLGSGRNWRSVIKRLLASASERDGSQWRALLVDLRNHGSSTTVPGIHPPHNLEAAAHDLLQLVDSHLRGKMPESIIGHSLGGKVALELMQQVALSNNTRSPPSQVWVLDSQPGSIASPHTTAADSVVTVLNTIKDIPLPMPSRNWLYKHCQTRGISEATSMWLGSNMVPMDRNAESSERFTWAFNVQGATAMYMSYRINSYWDVLSRPPAASSIHVVRAENSDRWNNQMWEQLLHCAKQSKQVPVGGRTYIHTLPKAGHWLHVDNPTGLLELLLPHFTKTPSG